MANGTREDQAVVHVTIDGNGYGVWDTMTGGTIGSTETKHRPGGMGAEISLGGYKQVENITITRNYDLDRDKPIEAALIAAVGKGNCVITRQPLDRDGHAFGEPRTFKGKLLSVKLPDVNSTSTTAAMIQIVVSAEATVS